MLMVDLLVAIVAVALLLPAMALGFVACFLVRVISAGFSWGWNGVEKWGR